MSIAEVNYRKFFKKAVDGCLYDCGLQDILYTACNLSNIRYGVALFSIPEQSGVKLPDGTDAPQNLFGVSVFEQVINGETYFPPVWPNYYPMGQPIKTMLHGRIQVIPETPTTPTDPVFIRFKAGPSGTEIGVFRNNDDSGSAVDANAPGSSRMCRWFMGTDSDGVAVLEFMS